MLTPGKPRHQQVSDWLRTQILQGTYRAGEQIPSESQLGAHFSVSRVTIRRALQTLEGEGLIIRKHGLGSFVQDLRMRQGLVKLTDFQEDMTHAGLEASSKVVYNGHENAAREVAEALDLKDTATVSRLDRLRLGDGEPIAFDRTWMPLFYAQLLSGHNLAHTSIYKILENEYEIPVLSGRYRIEAISAPAEVARHLMIAPEKPLLLISRISVTNGNKKVYYQQRYYRSDRVAYELELIRNTDSQMPISGGLPLRDFEPVFKKRK